MLVFTRPPLLLAELLHIDIDGHTVAGNHQSPSKLYTTRYWNKQFYQNGATVNLSASKPSGVDKLNGYRHAGDTAIVSKESKWGIFRTGLWYDSAYTDRYQIPSNILTQVNTPLGNFHEHFITQSTQPFAEFEWHVRPKLVITAGIKAANYAMGLNQDQDNGKTVGCLGRRGVHPIGHKCTDLHRRGCLHHTLGRPQQLVTEHCSALLS